MNPHEPISYLYIYECLLYAFSEALTIVKLSPVPSIELIFNLEKSSLHLVHIAAPGLNALLSFSLCVTNYNVLLVADSHTLHLCNFKRNFISNVNSIFSTRILIIF
jgi:hypothetical protein